MPPPHPWLDKCDSQSNFSLPCSASFNSNWLNESAFRIILQARNYMSVACLARVASRGFSVANKKQQFFHFVVSKSGHRCALHKYFTMGCTIARSH